MLIARAFIFGVSPRAALAVVAIALSVAYALVSAGVLDVLGTTGAALEEDRANPGHVLYSPDGGPFDASLSPPGSILVYRTLLDGVPVATVDPWPFEDERLVAGPYLGNVATDWEHLDFANATSMAAYDHGPLDALLVHPDDYRTLSGTKVRPVAAYMPGAEAPDTTLARAPWQGLAAFYEGGAGQLTGGLILVILASGAVVSLLAAGFVHLEVLARRGDLATLEALAGAERARRVVLGRTITLVTTGIVIGLVAALVTLRVAGSALGTPLRLGPLALVLALGAAAVGGVLFGTFAGWRALARDPAARLAGNRLSARRFPGPIRFLLVTPRLSAGVFTATLVTASILAVLSSASAVPTQLFQTDADSSVVVEGSDNPLRGTADRVLGTHGATYTGVQAASPETYAPTVLDGRPVMVKGVDLPAWRDWGSPRLDSGAWPTGPGEAMAGWRLARALDLAVGDTVVIPASYRIGIETVRVVAIVDGTSLENDELLVDLDTAGRLAALPQDKVTMVHLRLDDPEADVHALIPPSAVEVLSIRVSPQPPVPLTPASVEIELENRGPEAATRTLAVRVNDVVVEERTVTLRSGEARNETVRFLVPDTTKVKVEVNPTAESETQRGHFDLIMPDTTVRGEPFSLRARFASGTPVSNAGVLVDGDIYTATDANGRATVTLDEDGLYTISVVRGSGDSQARAGRTVLVHGPEWRDAPRLVVERIFFNAPTPVDGDTVRIRAEASLANLGGAAFDGDIGWSLDGEERPPVHLRLSAAGRTVVTSEFTTTYGDHTVALLGTSRTLTVRDDRSLESEGSVSRVRTVEDVLAEKAQRGGGTTAITDPSRAFLDRVFADLDTASSLVLMATLVHAGALVWVSVVREVRERNGVLTTLEALGATQTQTANRALRDTVVSTLPSIAAGLLVTALLLAIGRFFGFPQAFGHTLPTGDTFGLLFRTGVVLLLIALVAAHYAVRTDPRPRARGGPRQPLDELLAGETP
ncbi:MAG: hypothetical protein KY455_12295 [Euryarchaeota archaeon]|nr:hypothetical protein [Euryarchaeota archaeon]